jgi:heme/copper-type cytochrome/quinol oxidase subunit 4
MRTVTLAVAAASACTVLISLFMWWATKRSAIWGMAAGLLLGLVALIVVVLIALFMARAAWGTLDQVR